MAMVLIATGQWRSHWGGKGGRVPPLTAKNLPKIVKKRGKIRKKRKNREEKAKFGKVLSLCPSWLIGLATLLLQGVYGFQTKPPNKALIPVACKRLMWSLNVFADYLGKNAWMENFHFVHSHFVHKAVRPFPFRPTPRRPIPTSSTSTSSISISSILTSSNSHQGLRASSR